LSSTTIVKYEVVVLQWEYRAVVEVTVHVTMDHHPTNLLFSSFSTFFCLFVLYCFTSAVSSTPSKSRISYVDNLHFWRSDHFSILWLVQREAETRMLRVEGKQNSLFPVVPVNKCFVLPPNSKREQTPKKLFAWRRLAHKFATVLSCTTWSRAGRELLFPEGVSEVWHLTCSPAIGKRIWVGRYNNNCR